MAATVTPSGKLESLDLIVVAGDGSYATGGYALTGLGPNNVCIPAGGTHQGVWDSVNKKLLFIVSATGAEVANATNLATARIACLTC